MPKRMFTVDQEKQIVQEYLTRLPDGTWPGTPVLARKWGCSAATIQKTLRRQRVSLRSQRESHLGKVSRPRICNRPDTPPPFCQCGCGLPVSWDRKKKRWLKYALGLYTTMARSKTGRKNSHKKSSLPPPNAQYQDRPWLYNAYWTETRSLPEIAALCGVTYTAVKKAMVKFNIPRRSHSESLIARGSCAGPNNAAWKGGVAKWSYNSSWKSTCRIIRKRDNYTCQLCNTQFPKTSKRLHVHHIDSDKLNDSHGNLICLCSKCHHPLTGKAAEEAADRLRQIVLDRNPTLKGVPDEH